MTTPGAAPSKSAVNLTTELVESVLYRFPYPIARRWAFYLASDDLHKRVHGLQALCEGVLRYLATLATCDILGGGQDGEDLPSREEVARLRHFLMDPTLKSEGDVVLQYLKRGRRFLQMPPPDDEFSALLDDIRCERNEWAHAYETRFDRRVAEVHQAWLENTVRLLRDLYPLAKHPLIWIAHPASVPVLLMGASPRYLREGDSAVSCGNRRGLLLGSPDHTRYLDLYPCLCVQSGAAGTPARLEAVDKIIWEHDSPSRMEFITLPTLEFLETPSRSVEPDNLPDPERAARFLRNLVPGSAGVERYLEGQIEKPFRESPILDLYEEGSKSEVSLDLLVRQMRIGPRRGVLVLRAPGGAGKSHLLKQWVRELARRSLHSQEYPVPVLIEVGVNPGMIGTARDLLEHLAMVLGMKKQKEVKECLRAGQIVLFLDGLNEVPKGPERFVSLMNEFTSMPLVGATREVPNMLRRDEIRLLRLNTPNELQRTRIFEIYGHGRTRPPLKVDSPFLIRAAAEWQLPGVESRRFWEQVLERRLEPLAWGLKRQREVLDALPKLALAMAEVGQVGLSAAECIQKFEIQDPADALDGLLRSGILHREDAHLSFFHQLAQDHLAGQALSDAETSAEKLVRMVLGPKATLVEAVVQASRLQPEIAEALKVRLCALGPLPQSGPAVDGLQPGNRVDPLVLAARCAPRHSSALDDFAEQILAHPPEDQGEVLLALDDFPPDAVLRFLGGLLNHPLAKEALCLEILAAVDRQLRRGGPGSLTSELIVRVASVASRYFGCRRFVLAMAGGWWEALPEGRQFEVLEEVAARVARGEESEAAGIAHLLSPLGWKDPRLHLALTRLAQSADAPWGARARAITDLTFTRNPAGLDALMRLAERTDDAYGDLAFQESYGVALWAGDRHRNLLRASAACPSRQRHLRSYWANVAAVTRTGHPEYLDNLVNLFRQAARSGDVESCLLGLRMASPLRVLGKMTPVQAEALVAALEEVGTPQVQRLARATAGRFLGLAVALSSPRKSRTQSGCAEIRQEAPDLNKIWDGLQSEDPWTRRQAAASLAGSRPRDTQAFRLLVLALADNSEFVPISAALAFERSSERFRRGFLAWLLDGATESEPAAPGSRVRADCRSPQGLQYLAAFVLTANACSGSSGLFDSIISPVLALGGRAPSFVRHHQASSPSCWRFRERWTGEFEKIALEHPEPQVRAPMGEALLNLDPERGTRLLRDRLVGSRRDQHHLVREWSVDSLNHVMGTAWGQEEANWMACRQIMLDDPVAVVRATAARTFAQLAPREALDSLLKVQDQTITRYGPLRDFAESLHTWATRERDVPVTSRQPVPAAAHPDGREVARP